MKKIKDKKILLRIDRKTLDILNGISRRQKKSRSEVIRALFMPSNLYEEFVSYFNYHSQMSKVYLRLIKEFELRYPFLKTKKDKT